MSSAVTDFGATYWLQTLFGVSPQPAGYWVALATDEPGTSANGDTLADLEPQASDYNRIWVPSDATHWGTNGLYLTNGATIDFGIAQADWGTPNYYALCTAATSGDVYAYGELANPQDVHADDSVALPAGGIVLALVTSDAPIAV